VLILHGRLTERHLPPGSVQAGKCRWLHKPRKCRLEAGGADRSAPRRGRL